MKKLFAVGIFAISSLAMAGTVTGAKSYQITLSSPAKVGGIQLTAGRYLVKVKGDSAVFTNQETAKSFITPVKIEDKDKKFETTRIDSFKDGNTDVEVVKDIKLGGSKIQLDFGEL
jgi:hypothetical protein